MTETESHSPTRALVASFLFTDLVGYSKGTAAEQYAAKATLSAILSDNLSALRESDYRIKDTGDGAVIAFLSNPEHALYMALAITQDFARAARSAGFPSNTLRTGIHIGAVKEAIDVEARPNFIGDGINAAKRIMDFAAPGQITASGSYFEAVACLDSAYAELFQRLGSADDKHGRAHELYAISPNAAVLERFRLDLGAVARESAERDARTPPITVETQGPKTVVAAGTQTVLTQAVEVVRKWFIPINALIAFTIFASAGLERVAPNARGIRIASAALFAIAIVVGSMGLLRARGFGSLFWMRYPRIALAMASRATSLVVIATAVMLGIISIFLDAWTLEPIVGTVRPVAAESGSVASSAGGPAASPAAAEGGAASSLTSPAVPPKYEAAAPVRSTESADGAPPPELSRPTTVAPSAATNLNVQSKPSTTATPAARVPSSAAPYPGSARCNRIIEKAEIGEPLSEDERRELANSCR